MTPMQKEAITLAFIGTFFGWVALETMIIGLRMSKSALASYGEQCGVTVTFTFDALYFGREFLKTDWIAITLILSLQMFQAWKSAQKAGDDISTVSEDNDKFQ